MDNNQIDENSDDFFLNANDIEEEIEIFDDNVNSQQISDDEIDDTNERIDSNHSQSSSDDAIVVFSEHKKAVLCCSLNSSDSVVVSGDEDDCAYVWNADNGSVLFKCDGHKDSVVCASFNRSNAYVATADMSGLLQVWKIDGQKIFEYEVSDINWLLWHPIVNNVIMAGTVTGEAWLWKITGEFHCKTLQSYGSSNSAAKCLNDGNRVVMGYENGEIRIWDIKADKVLIDITGMNCHEGCVTSIDCTSDNSLIGTGSVDGTAKLINSQTGKVIVTFECSNSNTNTDNNVEVDSDSVECVSFSNTYSLFATGTVKGCIEIWDISSQLRRHKLSLDDGISKLLWHKNNQYLLYTAGLDGVLRIYDGRTGELSAIKSGHNHNILDCFLSNNCSFIVTSSEDTTCRIFSLQ